MFFVQSKKVRQKKKKNLTFSCLCLPACRTQKQNRSQALHKLREMINEAWEPAKERKMRTGISKAGKEIRKADKRHRSQVSRIAPSRASTRSARSSYTMMRRV